MSYEMFTPQGDEVVDAMVDSIVAEIRDGSLPRRRLIDRIRQGIREVASTSRDPGELTSWGEPIGSSRYDEVYDTEPQYGIEDAINRELEAQGWRPVSRWEF